MFEPDSEDEECFSCNLCDEDVDIEEVNEHIKQCLITLRDLYGEDKAKKFVFDSTKDLFNYEEEVNKMEYDELISFVKKATFRELSINEESEEEGVNEEGEESVDDGEKGGEMLEGLKRNLYDVEGYGVDFDEVDEKDFKSVFLMRLDEVIRQCEGIEGGRDKNDEFFSVATFVKFGEEELD